MSGQPASESRHFSPLRLPATSGYLGGMDRHFRRCRQRSAVGQTEKIGIAAALPVNLRQRKIFANGQHRRSVPKAEVHWPQAVELTRSGGLLRSKPVFLNRKIGAEQPLAGQTVVGIKSLQPFHVVDPAKHFVSHIGGISPIKGGISDNEAACAGCRIPRAIMTWIFVSPRSASRTRNPFFVQHMSDRLRASTRLKRLKIRSTRSIADQCICPTPWRMRYGS